MKNITKVKFHLVLLSGVETYLPSFCLFTSLQLVPFEIMKNVTLRLNVLGGLQYFSFKNEYISGNNYLLTQVTKEETSYIGIPLMGKIVWEEYGPYIQLGPTINVLISGDKKTTTINLQTSTGEKTEDAQFGYIGFAIGVGWQYFFQNKYGILVELNHYMTAARGEHSADNTFHVGGMYRVDFNI